MSGEASSVATVAALRADNSDLDTRLRELLTQVSDDRLTADPGDGHWTLAENLAHLAEFPRYFGREIMTMVHADGPVEVGRTHEHPERVAAIATATGKDRDQLVEAVSDALDELAAALEHLSDADLQRVFTNRKYGPETLAAYLTRYVLGHKSAHVDQLRQTLASVSG